MKFKMTDIFPTVEESFNDFLSSRKAKGLAEATIDTYYHHFMAMSHFFDKLKQSDIDTFIANMVNNILIEVLETIAEQERETIRKRQAEGIGAAKASSKKLGRPALTYP